MDALICFKIIPDLDKWSVDDRMDIRFVRTMINPYDEAAIEMALGLSAAAENLTEPVALSALTIGDASADPVLRTLLAFRFEKVTRVKATADLRFCPEDVADGIAAVIKGDGVRDIAFFGRQSGMGDNGMTPFLVAERLRWPCITGVVSVAPLPDRRLSVTSRTDGGILTQIVRPPVVLCVGETACATMRRPTLVDRMTFGKRPITIVDAPDPDQSRAADYAVRTVTWLRHERAGKRLEETDAKAIARRLYDDYLQPALKSR